MIELTPSITEADKLYENCPIAIGNSKIENQVCGPSFSFHWHWDGARPVTIEQQPHSVSTTVGIATNPVQDRLVPSSFGCPEVAPVLIPASANKWCDPCLGSFGWIVLSFSTGARATESKLWTIKVFCHVWTILKGNVCTVLLVTILCCCFTCARFHVLFISFWVQVNVGVSTSTNSCTENLSDLYMSDVWIRSQNYYSFSSNASEWLNLLTSE